jgi:hypothetical protein
MKQPAAGVTRADVIRLARRDFAARADEALAILSSYGAHKYEREDDRVHAAVIKLSNGSLDQLRIVVSAAKADYRDVLAEAEYPKHSKAMRWKDQEAEESAMRSDWQQYAIWFDRQ